MTHSSRADRERTIREALAPYAERFLCEYVILNAHDESVRRMWRDYAQADEIGA